MYAARRPAGIANTTPERQHPLASVAVAERAEPEHRAGQAERVADGDQVQVGLRGVERLPILAAPRWPRPGSGWRRPRRGSARRGRGRRRARSRCSLMSSSPQRSPRRGLPSLGEHCRPMPSDGSSPRRDLFADAAVATHGDGPLSGFDRAASAGGRCRGRPDRPGGGQAVFLNVIRSSNVRPPHTPKGSSRSEHGRLEARRRHRAGGADRLGPLLALEAVTLALAAAERWVEVDPAPCRGTWRRTASACAS